MRLLLLYFCLIKLECNFNDYWGTADPLVTVPTFLVLPFPLSPSPFFRLFSLIPSVDSSSLKSSRRMSKELQERKTPGVILFITASSPTYEEDKEIEWDEEEEVEEEEGIGEKPLTSLNFPRSVYLSTCCPSLEPLLAFFISSPAPKPFSRSS